MNGAAARFPEKSPADRQGPAGIHQIVYQQNGSTRTGTFYLKSVRYIAGLLSAVLHVLLFRRILNLNQDRIKRETEPFGQPSGKISDQLRPPQRRDSGNPGWRRLRLPPVFNQIYSRRHKFVAKPVILIFINPNLPTPAGITINAQTPALLIS
jgi:hypothetical protein